MSETLFYKDLNYTIDVKKLIPMGYTFQKLYAADYRTYRKEFGKHQEFTIWLWEKGKTIEINDWFSYTANVIEFYKNNLEQWKIENAKLPKPRSFMVLHANHSTGEVKLKDIDEYFKAMISSKGSIDNMKQYYKKYESWREIVLIPNDNLFNEVLKEVELLTKQKTAIKELTYLKIREIELQYGSLVKALESCKINKSTYYRWRKIVMSKPYLAVINKTK